VILHRELTFHARERLFHVVGDRLRHRLATATAHRTRRSVDARGEVARDVLLGQRAVLGPLALAVPGVEDDDLAFQLTELGRLAVHVMAQDLRRRLADGQVGHDVFELLA